MALLDRFHAFFRQRRMRDFQGRFSLTDSTTILDVGGTPLNWSFIETLPRIVLLNQGTKYANQATPNQTCVVGDGCSLDYPDGTFDITYSNSVIEHVGSWENQARFASETRRVGRSYYVQTPSKWFPLEPHVLGLFVHWIPARYRAPFVRWGTFVGLTGRMDRQRIDRQVAQVRLLTVKEMRTLFPDATIHRERFMGMTKSIVAMRITHAANGR